MLNFCCEDGNEGEKKLFQGAELQNFNNSVQLKLKQDALHDLTELNAKIKEQLMWSDVKLLRALLVFLETQSWVKQLHNTSCTVVTSDSEDDNLSDNDDDQVLSEVKESVDYLASHF